jgi:WD40 repeat protein
LWDIAAGKEMETVRGRAGIILSVAFSPDGRILASGSTDGTIGLWDVAMRREIATLEGHNGGIDSLAFSPDGKTLASGSWDGLTLWDMATRKWTDNLNTQAMVRCVAFSQDGKTVEFACNDRTISRLKVTPMNGTH